MAGLTIADKTAIWARARVDYEFFSKHFLKIRTNRIRGNNTRPTEGVEPFIHNKMQRAINGILFAQSAAGMEERLLGLKSRQEGFSTDIEGLAYWRCCFNEHYQVTVTAHLKGPANEIAGITHTFNDGLPDFAKPRLAGKPRAAGMAWANKSFITVETARSDNAARGPRRSMRHLSECGYYDAQRDKTSAANMMQATLSGMDDVAGTTVVCETTSRGGAGEFYDRFLMAVSGQSTWGWIFFSWKDSAKYMFDVTPEDAAEDLRMHAHFDRGELDQAKAIADKLKYTEIWFKRAIAFHLTPPQVRWAMKTQVNKFKNDIVAFDREFPLSWIIAFAAGGRTVIAREFLDAWRETSLPEGMIVGHTLVPGLTGFELDFRGEPYWEMYAAPAPGHEYVIGVDVAAGKGTDETSSTVAAGDFSAIQIFDRHTKEQVAEFYSKKTEPGPLGIEVLRAAVLYNRAFVVVERNNHGGEVISKLVDNGYRNLYREGNTSRQPRAGPKLNEQIGFWTDQASRTPLFDAWAEAIREGNYKPHSKRLEGECETFVYDQWDRPDHMKGCKSDAITASSLCWHGHRSLPAVRPLPTAPSAPQSEIQQAIAQWLADARNPKRRWRNNRHGSMMGGAT